MRLIANLAGDQFRFPLIDFESHLDWPIWRWGSVQIPLDRLRLDGVGLSLELGISSDSP